MEKQTSQNFLADGPKESIPVRGAPALIYRLQTEAGKLGMKLAPYCESLLNNFKHVEERGNNAIAELEQAKRKNALLESQLASAQSQISLLQTDAANSANIKNEMEVLKRQNSSMNSQVALFSDKHLLWLFEQAKGTSKTVQCPYGGTKDIQINEPKDLLIAMIYTFKIKIK